MRTLGSALSGVAIAGALALGFGCSTPNSGPSDAGGSTGGDSGGAALDGGAVLDDGGKPVTGDGSVIAGDGSVLSGDGSVLSGDGSVLSGDGSVVIVTGDGGALAGDGGTETALDAGPIVCDPHAVTGAATLADKTADWSLAGVVGNRLMAADLDGDGYPDLIVHAIYTNARETIGAAPKRVWVLMNRPKAGGGRQFVDATVDSGVFAIPGNTTQLRSAQLAVAGDVDNDGDLDLFSGTYVDTTHLETDPGDRSTVLLNDGTGHFTAATASAPAQVAQTTSGASFLDYDHNGTLDVFVGFWYTEYGFSFVGFSPELYRGAGDGTFEAVTEGAGLTFDTSGALSTVLAGTNPRPAYGVTTCDVDDDAWTDLLVSAYGRQWNQLFHSDRRGHFLEKGKASGFAGDDLVDFKDNQFFLCWCTFNTTAAECQGVAQPSIGGCSESYWNPGLDDQLARLNGNTFTTVCADLNGDGKLDLYNAEIKHWHIGQSSDPSQLLVSKSQPGDVGFDRPGNAATGLAFPHPTPDWNEGGMHAAPGDLNNDGRTDLVVGASDYPDQFGLVFLQQTEGQFAEKGAQMGMHHACLSGMAVADFDRDGDLDVVVGSGTARDCSATWKTNEVHLYQSDASTKGSWLEVRLVGDPAMKVNKAAIGAKVTVTVNGVSQVQELGGGYGHMAMQNDLVLFFGTGACGQVDSISVRWPDGKMTTETWRWVGTRRFVELRQGDPAVHEVVLP
ncbi:MAG: CRTAC1 family protein [Myxococcales bacterium]